MTLDFFLVFHHKFVEFFVEQGTDVPVGVLAEIENVHLVLERRQCVFVMIIDDNATRENTVLVILDTHRGADVGTMNVDVTGMDMIVETLDDGLCERVHADLGKRERFLRDKLEPLNNFVEIDLLEGSIAFDNIHGVFIVSGTLLIAKFQFMAHHEERA